jgi:ribose transport system ATP-binding protein
VRALARPDGAFREVTFVLGAGEILGVAGLQGSGASALLHALFGCSGALEGEAVLAGTAYAPSSPRAALERGVALVPGDRGVSVLTALSVLYNATLSNVARYSPRGFLNRARERADVLCESKALGLRAPSLDAPAAALSGGNQQKLALLRCLFTRPRVLLLDDPTRGVDLGAKAEIHALLQQLAGEGLGVLFHGTDLDELVAVSHRVLVFYRGRIVTTLTGSQISRERLLPSMMGALS